MKKTLLLVSFVLFSLVSLAQNFQWARSINADYAFVRSMAIDAEGNVYTTGEFSGTADFDPGTNVYTLTSKGDDDIFILKLDASGNFIWAKSIGGIKKDRGYSIAVDAFGNVYATGCFAGTVDFNHSLTSDRNLAVYILKLNSSGDFLWAHKFGGKADYDNSGHSVGVDASGNVYTTGWFNGIADFDSGESVSNLISLGTEDVFILKLDADGNFVWAKSFGGPTYDHGTSIAIGTSGNVYLSGFFSGPVDFDPDTSTYILNATSDGVRDIFVSKIDPIGNLIWAKSLGADDGHNSNSIGLDAFENVYTTGAFVRMSDFDPGSGIFNLTSSGTFDSNVFISKLDSSGAFVWAKCVGGTLVDRGESITIDDSGNVYTTGSFTGTVDFDPNETENILTATGGESSSDIFILKLSSSGDFEWAENFGETYFDTGYSIAVNASGDIYTSGTFEGKVDFYPGPRIFNLTSHQGTSGGANSFILKLGTTITDVDDAVNENHFSVYPNPAKDVIKIQSKTSREKLSFIIADQTGKPALSGKLNGTTTLVDISELPAGFYFVQVSEFHQNLVKIVKN